MLKRTWAGECGTYLCWWRLARRLFRRREIFKIERVEASLIIGVRLTESAAEFFPDAGWQRCVVHFYRNVFSHVPRPKMREVAAMLKAIHASEDVHEAREKALRVGAKLREQRMPKAAELVEGGIEETLAYYAFPEENWRRVRTNNPLERILREIRRRTRLVGAFPDGQSGGCQKQCLRRFL